MDKKENKIKKTVTKPSGTQRLGSLSHCSQNGLGFYISLQWLQWEACK